MAGFAGRWAWFLDLCAHFRVQYALGGVVLAISLILLKRLRMASLALGCALINAALLVPFLPVGASASASSGDQEFKVLLCNVNTHQGDPARVGAMLSNEQADVLVLQEISDRWVQELAPVLASYPYRCVSPREDNFGIVLFSRLPLMKQEVLYLGSAGVPSIEAELDTGRGSLYLLATHPVPPVGRERTILRDRQLLEAARRVPSNQAVLVLGDINATPWSRAYRVFVSASGLRDSGRGRGLLATWPTFMPLMGLPIDHCFHSDQVQILQRRKGPPVGSDHTPLIVEFTIHRKEQAREL